MSRFIEAESGNPYFYYNPWSEEDSSWTKDGYMATLDADESGLVVFMPQIDTITPDSLRNWFDADEAKVVSELGALVNSYAFQAELRRDAEGRPYIPDEVEATFHKTLFHDDEPIVTLLDADHPARQQQQ